MKKNLINLNPLKEQIKEKLITQYDTTTYLNTDEVTVKLSIKDLIDEYMNNRNVEEPSVYITTDAYAKMRMLVDETSSEIGWYGTVNKMPGLDNIYLIEDILVYPQKVTGVTCEQDTDKMFEFEMGLTTEQVNHRRFHGHSHVNMGCTPSGVDEQFYQDTLTQVTDYYIVLITNKRKDVYLRFYDVENNLVYEDLELKVLLENGEALEPWYLTQADKLTKPAPVVVNRAKNYSGSILDEIDNDNETFLSRYENTDWYDTLYRKSKKGKKR